MNAAYRALLVGVALMAIPTACADTNATSSGKSAAEASATGSGAAGSGTAEGTSGKSAAGSKATTTTIKVAEDDVFALASEGDVVVFRGGRTTAKSLAAVKPTPAVETPMPVVFTKGIDAVLQDRSRNQLRTVIANAKDARPELAQAEPMRVVRDQNGDLAIFVVVDNPTDTALRDLTIRVQVLKGGSEPVGSAGFVIGDDELASLDAGSAAVALLTMGKDRLTDPELSLSGIGIRLDLMAIPG